jgi:hypothetical protein
MAPTDPMTDEPQACPYLGLPDDARTRFSFATPAHRCYVKRKPSEIELAHQGMYCLSSGFRACNRFRAAATVAVRAEVAHSTAGAINSPRDSPSPTVPLPASGVLQPTQIAAGPSLPPVLRPTVKVVASTGLHTQIQSSDASPKRDRGLSPRRLVMLLLALFAAALGIALIVTRAIGQQ